MAELIPLSLLLLLCRRSSLASSLPASWPGCVFRPTRNCPSDTARPWLDNHKGCIYMSRGSGSGGPWAGTSTTNVCAWAPGPLLGAPKSLPGTMGEPSRRPRTAPSHSEDVLNGPARLLFLVAPQEGPETQEPSQSFGKACVFSIFVPGVFTATKTAQEAPWTTPRRTKKLPRGPQEGPRGPHDGPRGAQDGPNELPNGPKRGPR